MAWNNPVALTVVWSGATIALYQLGKAIHRRTPHWWTAPLVVTPTLLLAIALAFHVSYRDYSSGAHWLVALLGPATVAFAIPIYQQRALVRRHWPVLLAGALAGSCAAIGSAWALASLMGLSGDLRLSLLPRSVSTPFAMTVSSDIGGAPNLTAVFVVFTGLFGSALGETMLCWLPLRSALARGAMFGMGAHAVGVAKALQVGADEGSIAGLVMVLVGLLNVLAAPLLAQVLG
ncbi:MAG: LrgB family protein [Roseiarcus sp.]